MFVSRHVPRVRSPRVPELSSAAVYSIVRQFIERRIVYAREKSKRKWISEIPETMETTVRIDPPLIPNYRIEVFNYRNYRNRHVWRRSAGPNWPLYRRIWRASLAPRSVVTVAVTACTAVMRRNVRAKSTIDFSISSSER